MSTLFENYYDSLGHIIYIGSTVMCNTSGFRIYGHVTEMNIDKNGNEKYTVIPDIGYKSNKEIKLKKTYKVSWKNTYLINVTQRNKN